jgi:hypothetical protein
VWPPLGLVADLLALTGPDPDQAPLNDQGLAALRDHPMLAGLRGLGWPLSSRIALTALLIADHAHDRAFAPPAGAAQPLQAVLHTTIRQGPAASYDSPRPPVMTATELARAADRLPKRVHPLLRILGPEAAGTDPTLPLRLLHTTPSLPVISPALLALLPDEHGAAPASTSAAHQSARAPASGTPTVAHHGQASHIIPTHLGLPEQVFAYHQATSQLLYRRPSHHLIPRYQPCTLVLDTTPATFGPVEAVLRLLTHLLTTTLWQGGAVPTLVTTTHPGSPQPLTDPRQLPHIWTSRTLQGSGLDASLLTAAALGQRSIVIAHYHTAVRQRLAPTAQLTLVTSHLPSDRIPPPTRTYHHHLPTVPEPAQLTGLVAALLAPPAS